MKFNSNSVRKMIAAHIILLFVFLFCWSSFGIPWEIIYIFDVLTCVELAWALSSTQAVLHRARCKKIVPLLVIFALYLLITQVVNVVSPTLALRAFRKVFRFYFFFLACAVLLTEDWIEKIMKVLLIMQIPNFLLTLYQFFIMGLAQDYLGGAFGVEKGVNAYSNIYLCIICTYMIVTYLNKRARLLPMLFVVGSSLLIAVLAELKVFFIEIVVIILLGILFSHPSARTVKTIIFSTVGVVAATALLGIIFPAHLEVLMNLALLVQYTTGSIYGYNISRLNAFSEINQIFFKDSIIRNLFGYGFGNCDSGSAFYEKYSDYRYTWFTHQITFLETGYVGIALYTAFFVLVLIYATKSKKVNPENVLYYTFAQIIAVLCVIWMVYNQSLFAEVAYLAFFALAIPIAIRNDWVKCHTNRING